MALSEENTKPIKKTSWPSETFLSARGSAAQLEGHSFRGKQPSIDLSSNYYSDYISALNKKRDEAMEKPSRKKGFIYEVEKYCENTTLHGLRYVGDPQLTFGERIFWFISFSLAIGFAAYYISNIYDKWQSSPVITSFSPFDADISSIPFPAVTICNMNQAKKTEAEKILKEGSITEKKLLADSCNGNVTFNSTDNIDWKTLRSFLIRVGNSCSDILKWCQWGSDIVNCDDIFNNDLTDEGLCCSFNRLPPEKIFRNWKDVTVLNQTYTTNVYDWDAEKGYDDADSGDFVPRRPLGAGAHLGLSVVLDAQVDNYYCSSTRSTGFKVILSNPTETPQMSDFGFLVSTGFETRIAIEPSIREATASLRDVPIEKRQCYFINERPLQYYRKYSRGKCQLECQSISTFQRCGCIPYYMPRNDTTKLCAKNDRCTERTRELVEKDRGRYKNEDIERSYTKQNCLLECQSTHTLRRCGCVPYYLPKNQGLKYCGRNEKTCVDDAKEDMEAVTGNVSGCHCLPACYAIKYPYGKSFSHLSKTVSDDLQNMTSEYFKKNIAVMHFFFYNSKFMPELKSELFGFTEILSNTGGLMSLFLGFSFLSLVELLYFASIRLACNVHREKGFRKGDETPGLQLFRKNDSGK